MIHSINGPLLILIRSPFSRADNRLRFQTDHHRCRRSVFRPSFGRHRATTELPAMVDHEPGDGARPLSVFESGAILQYLAEKTGEFLPKDLRGRSRTMAGGSPLVRYSGRIIISAAMLVKIAYAIER